MSLEEIQNMLDATGIRFSYHHWEKPPSLPYGVFLDPYSNNFMADNQVYKSVNTSRSSCTQRARIPEPKMR